MNLGKLQLIVIAGFIGMFLVLYFGCSTTPKKQKLIEKSRAAQQESTSEIVLLREAKKLLPKDKLDLIQMYEHQLEVALDDEKIPIFKKLSSSWYTAGSGTLAGFYAEQIAKLDEESESWSIAATSYTFGARQAKDEKEKSFAVKRGLESYEKAISIKPENLDYKVNKALLLVDNPLADNPMKGIQELLQLNSDYPDNVSILNHLARLGLQTGQYDKAIARLQKALNIENQNETTICLLAEALSLAGNTKEAENYSAQCDSIKLLKENI